MASLLSLEQLELVCILCWKLWECRNSALWDNKVEDPRQIIEKAVFFLTEYRTAFISRGRCAAGVQWLSETKWRLPATGFIKVNVDGSVSEQQRLHGTGAVARDSSGEVLAAMVSKGQGLLSAEESEACGLRKALKWAKDLLFHRIVVETDCASIVTAINSDHHNFNSYLGTILLDCKHLMATFTSCRVQHVRRMGNSVAHKLARRALQVEADLFWVAETPDFIAPFVTGDRALA